MNNGRPPPTTLQALAHCDELAIALHQCADAEKQCGYDRLSLLSNVGIVVGGIGFFSTLMTTALLATNPITVAIGTVAGCVLAAGAISSGILGFIRDEKLGKAATVARTRVANIAKSILENHQQLVKTRTAIVEAASRTAAFSDPMTDQSATPFAVPLPTADHKEPAGDSRLLRPVAPPPKAAGHVPA